jgi:hypothetical protein
MDEKLLKTQLELLIKKAIYAEKSDDALKFSQAATNIANAMATINNIK